MKVDDAGEYSGFLDPESEKRYQAARAGVKRASAIQRLKETASSLVKGLKSDFPLITGARYDFAREELRKLNRRRSVTIQDAVNTLRKTVGKMSPADYDLFSRKRILDDLVWQKSEMPDSALPYGFTDESLDAEHKRVDAAIKGNDVINDAVGWEENIVKEINREVIKAAEAIGWHSLADKFRNPHYFRHVVLDYANAMSDGYKGGLHAPDRRGYYKKREGSLRDISANYIQAMGEVRALQLQDIEIMKTLKELKDNYDLSGSLKREAFVDNEARYMDILQDALGNPLDAEKEFNKLNKNQAIAMSRLVKLAKQDNLPEGKYGALVNALAEIGSVEELPDDMRPMLNRYLSWLAGLKKSDETDAAVMTARTYFKYTARKKETIKAALGKDYETWRDLVPEGYVEWHPFQNRMVFSVNTVAENLINAALEQGLNELSIPVDELQKRFVMGGWRQTWVIPKELAQTLDKLGTPIEHTALGKITRAFTSWWKRWVLHSPPMVLKYNIRNITGDADAVMAGNPGTFLYTPRAFKELSNVFLAGKDPDGELAEFMKRGGSIGARHIQELGDETTIKEFKRLMAKGEGALTRLGRAPLKLNDAYWRLTQAVSDFRENMLRYAAYLSYLEQMQKDPDGLPGNWGMSKRGEVLANRDIRDRAYKLSNELLGAYDQVSETGKMLRETLIPFYSWMEVNARRYAQFFANGMSDGGGGGKPPRVGGVAGGMDEGGGRGVFGHILRAPVYAWRFSRTLFMASLFGLAVMAHNRLWHGEEEDDLSPDVKGRPHIVLGRDAEGRVIYFDRIGATADLLDWFSLDTAHQDFRDIMNGQMTFGDYAKKITQAPVNKLVNGLTPFIKVPAEMISGKQFFPDAFNPRTIREMSVYVASTVGLTPEWIALTGRPSAGYLKTRAMGLFSYSQDPQQAAYYWIQDRKRQFQERVLGTEWSGASYSPRSMALFHFKQAVKYNDYEAKKRYMLEYQRLGGTVKGLNRSLDSMSPMAGLSEVDKDKFLKWLTPEDKSYLRNAYRYYEDIRNR
jgi:hypothetical protein